jgi:regulator of sigma E protease
MELLAQIPLIGGTLAIILPFLAVLSIVVFVHEYGHYIVGRWCGIKAEVFSIGFGKPLLKWTDRRGTRWQVAALPLGGFVRFVGDMDPASAGRAEDDDLSPEQRRVAFHNASLLRRALTVAAGPAANFLLSVLIFAVMSISIGLASNEPVIGKIGPDAVEDVGFLPGDRVLSIGDQEVGGFGDILGILSRTNGEPQPAVVERSGEVIQITVRYHREPRIAVVTPGMPAARAGLLGGDLFVSVNGEAVRSYRELQLVTAGLPHGAEIEVVVDREGKLHTFRFTPDVVERHHPVTTEIEPVPTMGIRGPLFAGIEPEREPMPIGRALSGGVADTWRIISGTLIYVGDMLFEGADTSQLGGPIRIAEVSGDAAQQGAQSLIGLIAILSASIGLINLFPIPILDGGHLMFYFFELLRGRPVGETWMKVGTMIGLSLVVLLMVFATYNDLVRL